MRFRPTLFILLTASGIYGCTTSPSVYFYALSRIDAETAAWPPAHTQAPFYIEVNAVEIPARVARAQLVITDRSGRVNIKEQHRWLAPLDDQIRAALSEELTHHLHTLDVSKIPYALDQPVYRITLDVQRFETRLDGSASGQSLIDAIWSMRRVSGSQKEPRTVLICQASVHTSTAPYLRALQHGHRHAIERIAHQIATAIRVLDAAPDTSAFTANDCPPITQ